MDLDIIGKEDTVSLSGGFRDILEDKEMQAYASVLYFLGMLHSVVPDEYIQVIKEYIYKKFPILEKVHAVNCLSKLCRKEKKEEIENIANRWRELISLGGFSEFQAKKIIKDEIEKLKPEHEEDLLVQEVSFQEDTDQKKAINPINDVKIGYKLDVEDNKITLDDSVRISNDYNKYKICGVPVINEPDHLFVVTASDLIPTPIKISKEHTISSCCVNSEGLTILEY